MNSPSPAIVTRAGAMRLPRWALWGLCTIYVAAGLFGRDAWKSADMAALGVMDQLAQGRTSWWHPSLPGLSAQEPGLLPYWLGALALRWTPPGVMDGDFAVRVPFAALLSLCMAATWYATYYLARLPGAQPVSFAFGGEARPREYARAIADAGLLALLACLGLAQLSHETTPAAAQLAFSALLYLGFAVTAQHPRLALCVAALALIGLGLSGATGVASALGLGAGLLVAWQGVRSEREQAATRTAAVGLALTFLSTGPALVAFLWQPWNSVVVWPAHTDAGWSGYGELWVWFTWPTWPLATWTLWRWRQNLHPTHTSLHLTLPLWFALVIGVDAAMHANTADRNLLLALPALASLAAFALPTLRRQVSALIDWFTLLFFSGCALIIWVVWIAMQTGFPSQPASNVARLAPGFEVHFSFGVFLLAAAASVAWVGLVQWRAGRHQNAIWKSLVLPAGGATLCWLLVMSLWLPLLDYAQSYGVLVQKTLTVMQPRACVHAFKLSHGPLAAFTYYGRLDMQPLDGPASCPWVMTEPRNDAAVDPLLSARGYRAHALIHHPANAGESVQLLYRHPAD